jgi:hypothetical protein
MEQGQSAGLMTHAGTHLESTNFDRILPDHKPFGSLFSALPAHARWAQVSLRGPHKYRLLRGIFPYDGGSREVL